MFEMFLTTMYGSLQSKVVEKLPPKENMSDGIVLFRSTCLRYKHSKYITLWAKRAG